MKMNAIRKYWWAAVSVVALAGCNPEEPAANSPVVAPGPGPAPSTGPGPSNPANTASIKPKTETPPTSPALDGPTKDGDKKDGDKKDGDNKDGDKKDGDKAALNGALLDKEIAAIKKLPADEQAVALKQIVCPVSNKHLGSMDKPVKITESGKTFYLCCDGCEDAVKADPKAILAKLKN